MAYDYNFTSVKHLPEAREISVGFVCKTTGMDEITQEV